MIRGECDKHLSSVLSFHFHRRHYHRAVVCQKQIQTNSKRRRAHTYVKKQNKKKTQV